MVRTLFMLTVSLVLILGLGGCSRNQKKSENEKWQPPDDWAEEKLPGDKGEGQLPKEWGVDEWEPSVEWEKNFPPEQDEKWPPPKDWGDEKWPEDSAK